MRVFVCGDNDPPPLNPASAFIDIIITQMQVQTLSLEILSSLTYQTALSIMQRYTPRWMALREGALLVLIEDRESCEELIKQVKRGAYFDLKSEVFEVLDSPNNAAALLENCIAVFTTPQHVRLFFEIQRQEEWENAGEEHARIDLLTSVYEPTANIQVEFDDSGLVVVPSPASSPFCEQASSEVVVHEFCQSSGEVVAEQQEKIPVVNNATNTQEQKTHAPQETREAEARDELKREIAFPIPPSTAVPLSEQPLPIPAKLRPIESAFLAVVLLLWVIWLVI